MPDEKSAIEKLKELARKWEEGLGPTQPRGEYDSGAEHAMTNCADELESQIPEIEALERENHRLKLNLIEPNIQLRINLAIEAERRRVMEPMGKLVEKWHEEASESVALWRLHRCADELEAALRGAKGKSDG